MRQARYNLRLVRRWTLVLLVAVVSAGSAGRAEAVVAMGPYLDFSSGNGTFKWDSDNKDFDVDMNSGAFGFALDSSKGDQSNFSYRLNVGIERQNLKDQSDVNMKMGGGVLENVFAFAMIRQPEMRWWVGPLLRIGYYGGESDEYHNTDGDRCKTESNLVEFGVGVATGINLKIGPHIYLAPSAGVRFIGVAGTGTIKNLDLHSQYDDDFSGNLTSFFANFSLLFD